MRFLDSIRGNTATDNPVEDEPDADDPFMTDGTGIMETTDTSEDFGDAFSDEATWDDDDDVFGDDGEVTAATDDLESRVKDIEREMESISSTVDTVRAENQHIGESVHDIEENVRKLVGVYEMVTRGINPFVDEDPVDAGVLSLEASLHADGPLGTIEQPTSNQAARTADAAPGDSDESTGSKEGTDNEDSPTDPPEIDTDTEPEDPHPVDGTTSNTDGKSFSDLESDFTEDLWDEPDDSWDDEYDALEETIELDFAPDTDPEPTPEVEPPGEPAPESQTDDDEASDQHEESEFDWGPHDTSSHARAHDPTPADSYLRHSATGPPTPGETLIHGSIHEQKPFLDHLLPGYTTEMLILEWLEYLIDQSTNSQATEAVDYYEDLEWISTSVATQLRAYLTGLNDQNRHDASPPSALTSKDHVQSLKYISQLASPRPGVVGFRSQTVGRRG